MPKDVKLLTRKKPRPAVVRDSFFRRHHIFDDGKMRSFPHPVERGIDGAAEVQKEYREHSYNDAEAHQTIIERVPRLVRQGKIRLVPASFQFGPGRNSISRYSEYKLDSGLDSYLLSADRASLTGIYHELMSQLAYLHTHANITHQDLKKGFGSNIIMWDKKRPYFSDFGLAEDMRRGRGLKRSASSSMLEDIDAVFSLFDDRLLEGELEEGLAKYRKIASKSPVADILERRGFMKHPTLERTKKRLKKQRLILDKMRRPFI